LFSPVDPAGFAGETNMERIFGKGGPIPGPCLGKAKALSANNPSRVIGEGPSANRVRGPSLRGQTSQLAPSPPGPPFQLSSEPQHAPGSTHPPPRYPCPGPPKNSDKCQHRPMWFHRRRLFPGPTGFGRFKQQRPIGPIRSDPRRELPIFEDVVDDGCGIITRGTKAGRMAGPGPGTRGPPPAYRPSGPQTWPHQKAARIHRQKKKRPYRRQNVPFRFFARGARARRGTTPHDRGHPANGHPLPSAKKKRRGSPFRAFGPLIHPRAVERQPRPVPPGPARKERNKKHAAG